MTVWWFVGDRQRVLFCRQVAKRAVRRFGVLHSPPVPYDPSEDQPYEFIRSYHLTCSVSGLRGNSNRRCCSPSHTCNKSNSYGKA